MADINEYQIKYFTPGKDRWRIDWFGPVTFAERYRRQSQPLIEIQLSHQQAKLENFSSLLTSRTTGQTKVIQTRLPVGFLPLLKVGDIWQDGRLVESPDYEIVDFDELEVGRHHCSIIKAGNKDDDSGGYYLPLSHHRHHLNHTQSYCLLCHHDTAEIVIPAMELIRFYFGSTSTLISRIFDTPFAQENLWLSSEPGERRGSHKIHLAPGISGRSASDIGRIAFSKIARESVELVANSCITASANGERIYPKSKFPFEGSTDLKASGNWLPFNGSERGVFLVFKLLSCSHPFPFSSLRYTSERMNSSNDSGQLKGGNKFDNPQEHFSKARKEEKSIVDQEPSSVKSTRSIRFFSTLQPKFPDLSKKTVAKTDIEQVPTIMRSAKGISIISGLSVGEGGKDPKIQPIYISSADTEDLKKLYNSRINCALTEKIFLNLVSKIRKSNQFSTVDIVRLDSRQKYDHLSNMPVITTEEGEVLPACLIATSANLDESMPSTRQRRISIARALELHVTHYFLMPEQYLSVSNLANQIELHIITDRTRAIADTSHLYAAIGAHFSLQENIQQHVTIAPGVESRGIKFIVLSEETSLIESAVQFFYDRLFEIIPT